MKTTLRILTVLLALCAVRAQASYTIQFQTSDPVTANPGTSGSSTFTYTLGANAGSPGTTWSSVNMPLEGNAYYAIYGLNPDDRTKNAGLFSSLSLDHNSLALVGPGKTFTTGSTYTFVVNWTIAANADATPIDLPDYLYFSFGLKDPNSTTKGTSQEIFFNIDTTAAVPEPSQTLAGTVVLGCGLLLGIGRRQFKRLLA